MKAVTWSELGAQPAVCDDLPVPTPGAGNLLVRVGASSVNPVASRSPPECSRTWFRTSSLSRSGVVEQVGNGVTGAATGDEVFGFVPAAGPTVHNGSWAELIVAPEVGSNP
jgi:NADPH2:quinone reductase